ncbi:four-carbon acid sugar kinase family protein [Gryllotalpicola reticulitermitis]|uniref:Four-carbon acid sugar kinase family protein n=1 Tax=Gryllotalpicola reticulitermitis TaxID=1184153 RepID=A0ABV8QC20_9MICO
MMSSEGDEHLCRFAWGIVADDLTGAGDCAVKFADAGWQVELNFGGRVDALAPAAAVAMTTDVRPLSETDASTRTAAAVTELIRAGAERLYLKIDSTLRGSVRGQISGALAAWTTVEPGAFAVVCPAYPAMGRTVVNGELFVYDLASGVGDAAAGDGVLTLRLSGASPEEDLQQVREAAQRSRVLFIDAAVDADLDRLAVVLERLGRVALPVGSAGLAGAIVRRATTTGDQGVSPQAGAASASAPAPAPAVLTASSERPPIASPTPTSTLVAVSSRHPITTAQVDVLVSQLGDDSRVRLVTTPADRLELDDDAVAARLVADRLAADVERLLVDEPVGSLVLVGGDGALAVLERLGVASVRVHGSAAEGVPLGVVHGGPLDGVRVVTKSGGFGESTTLHELVRGLIGASTQLTTEQDRP